MPACLDMHPAKVFQLAQFISMTLEPTFSACKQQTTPPFFLGKSIAPSTNERVPFDF